MEGPQGGHSPCHFERSVTLADCSERAEFLLNPMPTHNIQHTTTNQQKQQTNNNNNESEWQQQRGKGIKFKQQRRPRRRGTHRIAKTCWDTLRQTTHEQAATIKANRIFAEARRDFLKAQRELGETEDMETSMDDLHEPFADDQEM